MLSRVGGRLHGIDQDDEFGGVAGVFGLAETNGFEAFVFQLEILDKVIAHNFRTGFGENADFVGIALRFRGGDDGKAERILFEVFSCLIQGFLILQLRAIGLVENLFSIVVKVPRRCPGGEAGDGMPGQFSRVVVTALFKESTEKEIVLERFHIVTEGGDTSLGFVRERTGLFGNVFGCLTRDGVAVLDRIGLVEPKEISMYLSPKSPSVLMDAWESFLMILRVALRRFITTVTFPSDCEGKSISLTVPS